MIRLFLSQYWVCETKYADAFRNLTNLMFRVGACIARMRTQRGYRQILYLQIQPFRLRRANVDRSFRPDRLYATLQRSYRGKAMLSIDELKIGVKDWWSYKSVRNLRAGATSVRKKRVDRPEFHVGGTGRGVMG